MPWFLALQIAAILTPPNTKKGTNDKTPFDFIFLQSVAVVRTCQAICILGTDNNVGSYHEKTQMNRGKWL